MTFLAWVLPILELWALWVRIKAAFRPQRGRNATAAAPTIRAAGFNNGGRFTALQKTETSRITMKPDASRRCHRERSPALNPVGTVGHDH